MDRTTTRLKKRFIWVAMLCLLVGCGTSNGSKKELQSTNEVISFYEVYRLPDEKLTRVLEALPEIDGFIPITKLDYQNYRQNVVGVTDDEEKKQEILSKLAKMDSKPENSFFCWSKRKDENGISNEGFYYLYLLRNIAEESRIKNDEIIKAEVLFNKYSNTPEIRITFNESGKEKWSKMTQKAVRNNNDYTANDFIAMVIDSEVYFCPSVMTPMNNGVAIIAGFQDENEAEKIVERIEAMKNSKSTR